MTLEEYKNILITGTPSDRARAIAEAGNDRSLTDEDQFERGIFGHRRKAGRNNATGTEVPAHCVNRNNRC